MSERFRISAGASRPCWLTHARRTRGPAVTMVCCKTSPRARRGLSWGASERSCSPRPIQLSLLVDRSMSFEFGLARADAKAVTGD